MPGNLSKYFLIKLFASWFEIDNCLAKPNAEIPYMIPKFTAFALLLKSGVIFLYQY